MNVFTFDGFLGRDADVRKVGDASVVQFTVANKVGWAEKEKTNWINCSFWNREKIAPYLLKGSKVSVTGELTTREFDKKDGTRGFSLDCRVQDVSLPGKGDKVQAEPQSAPTATPPQQAKMEDTDDIPF